MALRDMFLPEMEMEFAASRRVLERVPEDKLDWQPHPKSMTLGRLASHVAEIPGWAGGMLPVDAFDLTPPEGTPYTSPRHQNRSDLLAAFDANAARAKSNLLALDDASMMSPWNLLKAGQILLTMPKAGVVRSLLMNHMIHHRGQLEVYLRLLDVPVPAIYGPSADEGGM